MAGSGVPVTTVAPASLGQSGPPSRGSHWPEMISLPVFWGGIYTCSPVTQVGEGDEGPNDNQRIIKYSVNQVVNRCAIIQAL